MLLRFILALFLLIGFFTFIFEMIGNSIIWIFTGKFNEPLIIFVLKEIKEL